MVAHLREVLGDTHTPQLEALDAMRYVLQLQADGVTSALDIEPFLMYTTARVWQILLVWKRIELGCITKKSIEETYGAPRACSCHFICVVSSHMWW